MEIQGLGRFVHAIHVAGIGRYRYTLIYVHILHALHFLLTDQTPMLKDHKSLDLSLASRRSIFIALFLWN